MPVFCYQLPPLRMLVFLLLLLAGVHKPHAYAQALVCNQQSFEVPVSYEDTLKQLEGENSTRLMFASQDVQLLTFQPNNSKNPKPSDDDTTYATIDITGYSCEFGHMCYMLSVKATSQETLIDVRLLQPVGMLRHQLYRYTIKPIDKTHTSVHIAHDLEVTLKHSRLHLVNQLIKKITFQKAGEEVCSLTRKMTDRVRELTLRQDPKRSSQGDKPDSPDTDESEDEESKEGDAPSSASQTESPAEGSTTSDSVSPSQETLTPSPAMEDETISANAAPSPSDSPASEAKPTSDPLPNSLASPEARTTPLPNSEASAKQESSTEAPIATKSTESSPSTVTSPAEVVSDSRPREVQAPTSASEKKEPQPAEKVEPTLKITIENVSQSTGTIRIAIFQNLEDYRLFDARKEDASQGKAFRKVEVKIPANRKVTHEFKDVPPGRYAIAAFHDQDGNKKLNASLLGLPNEPYGFSRDARGTLGAPKFDDAAIQFDAEHSQFRFRVK